MAQHSVPRYIVVGDDGQTYGPVDYTTLEQWAISHRINATTKLIEEMSGKTFRAEDFPDLRKYLVGMPPVSGSGPHYGGSYAAPPGYQTGNPYGAQAPAAGPNNGLGIASMVLGICGIVLICIPCLGPICSILAIIFALFSFSTPGKPYGIAGICCGGAGLLFWLLYFFVLAASFANGSSHALH